MPKDTQKLSLSMDTWVKIGIVLLAHGSILLGAAWKLSQQYEHRLTILETNQAIFMEIVKGQHFTP